MRNLENELGATLFDRSTHKVALTDAGRALLPQARATLAAATAARDAVDAVRGGVRGTVLLGTMQFQGTQAIDVPGLLAEFRAEHPFVEVHIRHAAGGSSEMAAHVKDGRLDLAFVALPPTEIPGIELTPLAREPIMVLTAASHPLANRKIVTLAEVAEQPQAEFPQGWGVRIANDRAFAARGLTRTITYEINDTGSVIEFVRHGLALAMLPASLANASNELRLVPLRGAPEFLTAIAAPSGRRLTAATQALLEAITKRANG